MDVRRSRDLHRSVIDGAISTAIFAEDEARKRIPTGGVLAVQTTVAAGIYFAVSDESA